MVKIKKKGNHMRNIVKRVIKRKKRIGFDPTDREILRVLSRARLSATPSKIARTINIHPSTAKSRVQRLHHMKLVTLKSRGNRIFVKADKAAIKRKLKKG